MPTTHTWKPTNTGHILDATNFADGTAFAPGDTLVVNGGSPNAQSISGNLAPLTSGNYQFSTTAANTSLNLVNMQLDAASTLGVVGPQTLQWIMQGQFVNDGAIQIGSAAGSGSVRFPIYDISLSGPPATFTNTGSIVLRNGSRFQTDTIVDKNDVILNAAGAVLSVNSGSVFTNTVQFVDDAAHITNNGLIAVNGTAGQTTRFLSGGDYSGAGLLSVRGASGAAQTDTAAKFNYTSASGTFDIASGELSYTKYPDVSGPPRGKPMGGTVNFLDNNGLLRAEDPNSPPSGDVVSATINGFQAGDRIILAAYAQATGLTYDPATHQLTVTLVGFGATPPPPVHFTLAGNYTQADFQVTHQYEADQLTIDNITTTTNTANAIPGFTTVDTATGAAGSSAGQQYAGPVNYLQSQYIWASADGANLVTHMPNTFLQGGAGNDALVASAGSNVLDGGLGSNFLTGATGADGGRDTFFLDGSAGTTWDTVANFHPGDSATLWGFVPGQSTLAWTANEGATGHTGATIHSAFAGAGTAVNGSVTFQGISLADAQSKITLTPGSVGGRSYLQAHYNG